MYCIHLLQDYAMQAASCKLLLCILFNPEHGGSTFPTKHQRITMTTWHHIPEDITLAEQDTLAKYWKTSRIYKKGGKKLERKG
jgi:hypothetical protein